MNTQLCFAKAVLAILLTLAGSAAMACELQRTELGGWAGECNLSKYFEDLDVELIDQDPHPLILPNLRITEVDTQTWRDEIEFIVELENNGWTDAQAFDVAGVTSIIRMDDNTVVEQRPFRVRLAGLNAQTRSWKYVVTAKAPDREYTYDFVTMVTVDPQSSSSAMAGEVIESREDDNVRTWSCRVLGEGPGQQIPAANNCFL